MIITIHGNTNVKHLDITLNYVTNYLFLNLQIYCLLVILDFKNVLVYS